MKKLPTPTREKKELPEQEAIIEEKPIQTEIISEKPVESEIVNEKPEETPKLETTPEETSQKETIPKESPEKTEKPSDVLGENCVKVGDRIIEIKPTKLKYFRNKAASAYGVIKVVPIHELMTYDAGVLDQTRDADTLLYDFLVAAFDDPVIVKENYNEFDVETIERIIKIFGRLNHIDEKQEAIRKNKEAQAKP